jgi:hypothetical protein
LWIEVSASARKRQPLRTRQERRNSPALTFFNQIKKPNPLTVHESSLLCWLMIGGTHSFKNFPAAYDGRSLKVSEHELGFMEKDRVLEIIRQGENERVEFKPVSILKEQADFCAGLVALANRHGGTFLLGVNDDGSLEGAKIEGDELVTQISNLAKDKCSPSVVFDFKVHPLEEGDVLALDVHRRRSIPSAVVDRRGGEIRNRIYYVRGANGKRLVEDSELEWMFKNTDEPSFQSLFRISIPYNRKTLELALTESPRVFLELGLFLQISSEDLEYLLVDETKRASEFFLEILPYGLLRHFSWILRNSCLVKITRRKGEIRFPPERVPSREEIDVLKIPQPKDWPILGSLKTKPWYAFQNLPGLISVPRGTSINVSRDPNRSSATQLLFIKENAFKFTFTFEFRGWNVGMPWGDPRRVQKMIKFKEYNPDATLATVTADCLFEAKFAFPNLPDPDFAAHHRYARLIEDLLKEEWDFDNYLRSLPDIQLFLIENKIDSVLAAVKSLGNGKAVDSEK